jgi:Fic family protein
VLNYVRAMRRGRDLLETLPVCLRLIREVHGELMKEVRGERERPGEFRRDQNWISGDRGRDITQARFVPPPPPQMHEALGALEGYLTQEQRDDGDPVLVQLALAHYQFETIHPFRDGNGRIGRLLLPLLLLSHRRIEAPVLYLSAYFERNRDAYQDLMLRVSQTGDWKSWVDFFLVGVRESAEEATRQAEGLLDLRTRYHRALQKGRSSALLIRLVDRLFQTPSITIGDAAALLGVTQQAASNNLRRLVAEGIVREVTGRSRRMVFVADEVMQFMYDTPPPR